ncbi:MAG: hypothetical protein COA50_12760 [Flavobacteriaceae bacterium]|nr:MAG: hypothetical protein COA50_12760 [Flavobacteriaceae bacterium]
MKEYIRIFKPYLRGFPLIIMAMIIAFMVAKKYLSYVTPMYESTSKLKLADISEGVTGTNLFKDLDVFATTNRIAAEIEVIKSEVLLNKVFDELDFDIEIFRKGKIKVVELYQQSPITIEYINADEKVYDKLFELSIDNEQHYELTDPISNQTYNGKMGTTLNLPNVALLISLNTTHLTENPHINILDDYQFQILSRQKLLSTVKKSLDVTAVDKDVPIIRINYKSANPLKASKLADKLTRVYIKDYIENKHRAANITVDFLIDRINEVLQKLSTSEENIQNYRNKKNITNITQETETDLRQLAQLEIQQTNLKMNLEAIQELESYIKEGQDNFLELAPNFEAFTYLLSTEMVKNIKALQAEKRDLLLVYTPENKKVIVVDGKIKDITSYLAEGVSNTRKNLEVKYKNLNNKIEATRQLFIGIPNKEKVMKILTREFEIYQESYTFLNEKKIEAEIAQAAKIAFHRIITQAQVPKGSVSPNRTVITIVAVLVGMLSAILLIYMVHLIKGKVNDAYTVESNSLLPIVMLTPVLKNKQEIESHFQQQAVQLEIKEIIYDKDIICFSSFEHNEGAAYNSFHLVNALMRQNKKVLFIDVENTLNIIQEDHDSPVFIEDNLDMLKLTHVFYNSYTKHKMQAFIETFQEKYDIVVLLNEKLGDPKSILLMSIATANIVVLDTRLTPAKNITEVDILKEKFDLPPTYFALNRVGHNPNIVRVAIKFGKQYFQILKSKLRK